MHQFCDWGPLSWRLDVVLSTTGDGLCFILPSQWLSLLGRRGGGRAEVGKPAMNTSIQYWGTSNNCQPLYATEIELTAGLDSQGFKKGFTSCLIQDIQECKYSENKQLGVCLSAGWGRWFVVSQFCFTHTSLAVTLLNSPPPQVSNTKIRMTLRYNTFVLDHILWSGVWHWRRFKGQLVIICIHSHVASLPAAVQTSSHSSAAIPVHW